VIGHMNLMPIEVTKQCLANAAWFLRQDTVPIVRCQHTCNLSTQEAETGRS
jgi:hypothetical protein